MKTMYDWIQKWLYTVENNQVLSAIKKGFMLVIPIVLTGSFALLLRNFPLPIYQDWLASFSKGALLMLLDFIFDATTGVVSLYLVIAISYFYSDIFARENMLLRMMAMSASMACFMASFGGASGSLELSCFGTVGVFSAMICGIVATRLFFSLDLRQFQRFHSYAAGNDIHYRNAISAVIPMILVVVLFAVGNLLLVRLFGVGNLNELISGMLSHIFAQFYAEPGNGLLFLLMLGLLWFFGIHGGNALDPVAQTIFTAGEGQVSTVITKSFLDNFAFIGGSGTSLCLVLALLWAAKNRDNRQVAYSALPLSLFNINEFLVFGLPIVLNPLFLIPFVLTPLISMLIAYSAVVLGWMPTCEQSVNWTTPVFFSGYLATGSWRGAAVQLMILAAGTIVYLPFIQLSERLRQDRTAYHLRELLDDFRASAEENHPSSYLQRNDHLGVMAKALVSQLHHDLTQGQINVYYQPQINAHGQVIGAEALLRWQYEGTMIYPPLVVALAQEDGCYEALTWTILMQVCQDMAVMDAQLGQNISVSVNLTAEQVNDPHMIQKILTLTKRQAVEGYLVLEITEETSLLAFPNIGAHIERLREANIKLAIDDFGMGQTSLNYLKNNNFSFVKLDGSLVRQVTENARCREIIGSIISLGNVLGFEVIAEWVENEAIRDHMLALGCTIYQGYFYSPALPLPEMIAFAKEKLA